MISERIKELRARSNMSQVKLAKALNVSRSTVNAWEMDLSMPTIKYVIEMSKLFNVTSDYILELDNSNVISLSTLNEKQVKAIMNIIDCFKKY
mgnify:CR=1 FL=1